MSDYQGENLCHDPIHGYLRIASPRPSDPAEVTERHLIDHPWVQRMRQIHQLQTAWWVFPSAEHTRFQHILGVMHLASQATEQLYPSLSEVDPTTPSRAYVELLLRCAGLLHDVGHGPFGHFFDEHYLQRFGLTHETLGAWIIEQELAPILSQLKRSPAGSIQPETSASKTPTTNQLDPAQVAWLIQRPKSGAADLDPSRPKWLTLLRSLFCGIYTIDNMDFVLRDAYMTGVSQRAFDLKRMLHYSFFSPRGLTIHDRGIAAVVHFLSMKAELFRSVYFHRTVRAIDLELADLFDASRSWIFPGDPREHLAEYLEFTEFSLLSDVRRWRKSTSPELRSLGMRWSELPSRKIPWIAVCQRRLSFGEEHAETSSIFSSSSLVTQAIRDRLPADMKKIDFRVDIARHIHRPHTRGIAAGHNFFFDSFSGQTRPLHADGLYQRLPISHRICRIYAKDPQVASILSPILDQLAGAAIEDDLTNM